jgi:hypothetical protein
MSKKISFLQIIFTALLFILPAFGQDLQSDLGNFFIKYDVIRLDNQAARQNAETGQIISVRTSERAFALVLAPRDLRSPRYRAEDAGASGVRQLERGAVNTFKGKVSGEANSEVRLTIDVNGIEGYFDSNNERFFIEPARKYSRVAASGDLVVYRETDLRKNYGFFCETGIGQKIERGKQIAAANAASRMSPMRVIEIATEADFEYVTALNSAAQANNEILGILNMTEGIYESELGFTFSVVYQHSWSTQDPFVAADRPGLLNVFKDHWNANFSVSQFPRDVAHLFTGKSYALSAGHAFIGVICANGAFSYGLSGYIDWAPGKFLITAHELGHNLGAHHADAPESCANTLMNAQLSGTTPMTFCSFSQNEMTSFVTSSGSCLENAGGAQCDFDGDAKTDFSIFRITLGEWWYLRSSDNQNRAFQFGTSSDRIVPGDYTGDGKTDVAIFRPISGEWFVLRSEDSSYYSFPFGAREDIPAPADFDGDGKADAAVFRPATAIWYILRSSGGTTIQQFGANGDFPTPGDYDGDGRADIAIFRPSGGEWWLQRSSSGTVAYQFGNGADKPVAADYTGDGKTDVAIFRPSNGFWYVLRSEDVSFYSAPFGISTDTPSPGDYDGDGKADFAIFRPTDATWYVNKSSGGSLIRQFGLPSDKPVPSAFVP